MKLGVFVLFFFLAFINVFGFQLCCFATKSSKPKQLTKTIKPLPSATPIIENKKVIVTPPPEINGPIKGDLYLTSPDSGKIIHVDFNDGYKINEMQLMGIPWEMAFDKIKKILFVTDIAGDRIFQINTNESKTPDSILLPAMSQPKDIEISDDGSLEYVLLSQSNIFEIYNSKDISKPISRIKLPPYPSNFSIIMSLNTAAITCPNSNNIIFIDLIRLEENGNLKLDGNPEKIISDEVNKVFYVSSRNANKVFIVNAETHTLQSTITVGNAPTSLVLSPSSNFLYVGNGKSDTINIIDIEANEIKDEIKLPIQTQFPSDLKITSDGKWLICTSESTGNVAIINLKTNKISKIIDVGVTTHTAFIVD